MRVQVDWALQDRTFYQAAVLDAAVRSGLLKSLADGADVTTLVRKGFREPFLSAVLEILGGWGWVTQDEARRWTLCRVPDVYESVLRVDHVRRWAALPDMLRPGAGLDFDVARAEQAWLNRHSCDLSAWILTQLGSLDGERWLDLGGGPGWLSRGLTARGAEVTIADLPAVAAQWDAEATQGIEVWAGDIFSAFPPGSYDGIALVRFIESFPPQKLSSLFQRCGQHLREHGRLLVAGYFDNRSEASRLFDLHIRLDQPGGRVYAVEDIAALANSSQFGATKAITNSDNGYGILILKKGQVGQEPNDGGQESQPPDSCDDDQKVLHRRALACQQQQGIGEQTAHPDHRNHA